MANCGSQPGFINIYIAKSSTRRELEKGERGGQKWRAAKIEPEEETLRRGGKSIVASLFINLNFVYYVILSILHLLFPICMMHVS